MNAVEKVLLALETMSPVILLISIIGGIIFYKNKQKKLACLEIIIGIGIVFILKTYTAALYPEASLNSQQSSPLNYIIFAFCLTNLGRAYRKYLNEKNKDESDNW